MVNPAGGGQPYRPIHQPQQMHVNSDAAVGKKLNSLLKQYQKAVEEYFGPPMDTSKLPALTKLTAEVASYISKNKGAIEQACKDKGYPASGYGAGYDTYIQEIGNSAANLLSALKDNNPGRVSAAVDSVCEGMTQLATFSTKQNPNPH